MTRHDLIGARLPCGDRHPEPTDSASANVPSEVGRVKILADPEPPFATTRSQRLRAPKSFYPNDYHVVEGY